MCVDTKATSMSQPAKSSSWMKKSSVAMLNEFWRLPRYSPIICLLTPLRDMKNLATARGVFSKNPCAHFNSTLHYNSVQFISIQFNQFHNLLREVVDAAFRFLVE